jgi:hypothetical protein
MHLEFLVPSGECSEKQLMQSLRILTRSYTFVFAYIITCVPKILQLQKDIRGMLATQLSSILQ